MKSKPFLLPLLACFAGLGCGTLGAAVIEADPSNYRSLLASLNPGDTLLLARGTYTSGLPLNGTTGTASQPIVVRGPDDQSAVLKADDCCNTVQLENVAFVRVMNLTLDGAGTNGAFGVDARGVTHDVTIENLKIINYGADQQVVGISTKGPAWNWVIRRNVIIGAGTGVYLGSSDGTAPFVNGLIEHNVLLDTIGYSMQVKHQQPRPSNVGLPTGQSRTIIRHNVFSKQHNAAGGASARPNLLVGHFPLTGAGSTDRYEIYGNFFYQNPTEALFQGEGNLVLHDNLFVNASGTAINVVPHNDVPRAVDVYHNTVVATGNGIRVSGGDPAYVQRIVGNAVFAGTPISGPNQQDNVTGSYAAAADNLVAPTAPIGSLDLFPKPGRLNGTAIGLSSFTGYVDGTRDFNGLTRNGTFRGAYEGEGTNPGWTPALEIKPAPGGTTAPQISFAADPTTVSLQGSSTLTWSATDATGCTASGGWSGTKAFSGNQPVGPLVTTTTFALTCTGPGGSASRSVTVTVAGVTPAPTVILTASPTSVASGESSSLDWQSTNATTCTASGGWTGSRATGGSQVVGPIQSSTSYTLTCTGNGGSGSATVSITVAAAPTLSFQADRTTVPSGEAATLTWSASNATSCTASGAWSGNKASSGTQSTGAIAASSTYTLTCVGDGGSVTRQVTVSLDAGGGSGKQGGGGCSSPGVLLLMSLLFRRKQRFLQAN